MTTWHPFEKPLPFKAAQTKSPPFVSLCKWNTLHFSNRMTQFLLVVYIWRNSIPTRHIIVDPHSRHLDKQLICWVCLPCETQEMPSYVNRQKVGFSMCMCMWPWAMLSHSYFFISFSLYKLMYWEQSEEWQPEVRVWRGWGLRGGAGSGSPRRVCSCLCVYIYKWSFLWFQCLSCVCGVPLVLTSPFKINSNTKIITKFTKKPHLPH